MNQPNPASPTQETRQRIITSALEMFSRLGYAQATTRALAEAAGVNEVTLFRHFGHKKNLLFACIEQRNEAGFAANFESILTGNYADDILRMARLQIKDMQASKEILRLLICEARTIPELRQALAAGSRQNLARLSAYFQRQIDAGIVLPYLSADVLASAFDSLFSTNLLYETFFQASISPWLAGDEMVRNLVDIFVRGTQKVLA